MVIKIPMMSLTSAEVVEVVARVVRKFSFLFISLFVFSGAGDLVCVMGVWKIGLKDFVK